MRVFPAAPDRTPARCWPTRGTYQTVGCPIKLSDSPVAVSRPPLLGEHTDVLLESLCGVEPDEAKRLRQEGVV